MARVFVANSLTHLRRTEARLILLGLLTVLYGWSFKFLYGWLGSGATALSFILVFLVAWLLGSRVGVIAGPLGVALNLALLVAVGEKDWIAMWQNGGAMGTVVLLLTGAVVGKISDLMRASQRTELILRQQLAINRSVAELATALISQRSLEEIAALVLAHMQELTHSPYGYIACVDADMGRLLTAKLNWPACENKPMLVQNLLQRVEALRPLLEQNRTPLIWNEMPEGRWLLEAQPEEVAVWRLLAAPAFLEGNLVGVIAIFNAAQPYLADSQEIAQKLSSLYAIAIQKQRIEKQYQYMSMHGIHKLA